MSCRLVPLLILLVWVVGGFFAVPQNACCDQIQDHLALGKQALSERNFPEAVKNLTAAGGVAHGEALFLLGELYSVGVGLPASIADAVRLFKEAVQLGNASAANNLALFLINGHACSSNDEDDQQALKLLKESANQLNPTAENNLGRLHDVGSVVAADDAIARSYYEKAQKHGMEKAQDRLNLRADRRPYVVNCRARA